VNEPWFEIVLDAEAQDQDTPSLAPWVRTRRGLLLPPGAIQVPGNGASPWALAVAQGASAPLPRRW
jgi:hypothetical protein